MSCVQSLRRHLKRRRTFWKEVGVIIILTITIRSTIIITIPTVTVIGMPAFGWCGSPTGSWLTNRLLVQPPSHGITVGRAREVKSISCVVPASEYLLNAVVQCLFPNSCHGRLCIVMVRWCHTAAIASSLSLPLPLHIILVSLFLVFHCSCQNDIGHNAVRPKIEIMCE
jgi:hypothetical protein